MSEYQELKHQADIGADFKSFMGTPVGQYLINRAEIEENRALRKITKVDPMDSSKVAMLQIEAQIPRKVIGWIKDVINQGEDAKYIIDSMEAESDES